ASPLSVSYDTDNINHTFDSGNLFCWQFHAQGGHRAGNIAGKNQRPNRLQETGLLASVIYCWA
ncbi:TPA: hypothetical protein ACGEFM_005661, partial [Klebsiella pneumoniae]